MTQDHQRAYQALGTGDRRDALSVRDPKMREIVLRAIANREVQNTRELAVNLAATRQEMDDAERKHLRLKDELADRMKWTYGQCRLPYFGPKVARLLRLDVFTIFLEQPRFRA